MMMIVLAVPEELTLLLARVVKAEHLGRARGTVPYMRCDPGMQPVFLMVPKLWHQPNGATH